MKHKEWLAYAWFLFNLLCTVGLSILIYRNAHWSVAFVCTIAMLHINCADYDKRLTKLKDEAYDKFFADMRGPR